MENRSQSTPEEIAELLSKSIFKKVATQMLSNPTPDQVHEVIRHLVLKLQQAVAHDPVTPSVEEDQTGDADREAEMDSPGDKEQAASTPQKSTPRQEKRLIDRLANALQEYKQDCEEKETSVRVPAIKDHEKELQHLVEQAHSFEPSELQDALDRMKEEKQQDGAKRANYMHKCRTALEMGLRFHGAVDVYGEKGLRGYLKGKTYKRAGKHRGISVSYAKRKMNLANYAKDPFTIWILSGHIAPNVIEKAPHNKVAQFCRTNAEISTTFGPTGYVPVVESDGDEVACQKTSGEEDEIEMESEQESEMESEEESEMETQ